MEPSETDSKRRRSRRMIFVIMLLTPVLYWWSLGPVAYAAGRCNSTAVWRMVHLYNTPSNWLARRWRWYRVVTVNRQTRWAGSGAWDAISE